MKTGKELQALLKLSHALANPLNPLAILGEGNVSVRLSEKTFLVKASGSSLGSLGPEGVVECHTATLLPLLDKRNVSDTEVAGALMAARTNARAKRPSVEALFHAWFLTLPAVKFVGH